MTSTNTGRSWVMLKSIVQTYISPTLKSQGFRKRATTWNRRLDDLVHVFDVQKRRSHVGQLDFTINIGVFLDRVWAISWNKVLPKFVKEQDSFPRFRVGLLLSDWDPKCLDKWWTVVSENEIETVGEEVRAIISEKCIPLLDSLAELETVYDFATQRIQQARYVLPLERIQYAILQHLVGKAEAATNLLNEFAADDYWGPRAHSVAMRLQQIS